MTRLRYLWPDLCAGIFYATLAALALSSPTSAQTVTVNGAAWPDDAWQPVGHRQHHQRQVVAPGEVIDVWLTIRGGEMVVAAISSRPDHTELLVPPVPVHRDLRVEVLGTVAESAGPVWPGCFITARSGHLDLVPDNGEWQASHDFLAWYLRELPARDAVPDEVVAELAADVVGADYTDTNPKTTQQGSPRQVWGEWGPALATRYGFAFDWAVLVPWTDTQGAWRAVHWDVDPADWRYDERPYDRDVEIGGKAIPCWAFDRQHFTGTQVLLHAVLTDDPVAWHTADAHARALWSQVAHGKFEREDNLRAIGWPLEYLALHHAATGEARDVEAVEVIIDGLRDTMQWYPVPWPTVNEAARTRNDHGQCGISTWMLARIRVALARWSSLGLDVEDLVEVCDASLDYARMVSDGPGAWPDDYDIGRVYTHTNPLGSLNTRASCHMAYWQARPLRPDRAAYVTAWYRQANHMRVGDKNADWPMILRVGPVEGWR